MGAPTTLFIDDDAAWWSVPPAEVTAALAVKPLVVLLHGRGADERDLAGLVAALPEDYLYVSLRAPLPFQTFGAGYQWFTPTADGLHPDPDVVNAAAHAVLAWLERTQARVRTHGLVALLGFSQGAALSVQLLRHAPEIFAGAVALSGFVAHGLLAGDEAMAQIRPPVFWGYDVADPVIPPQATTDLRVFLNGHANAVEKRYPGAGHGITIEEAADVAAFLRSILTS